jgi:hypothetical protein
MGTKNFYDIHFHAMNLAHPNLLAFTRRINWQLLLLASPLTPLAALFGAHRVKNVLNLLSVMENDAGAFFMMVEYCLRQQGDLVRDGRITIGDESFDRMVITPLMMDFGFKNILSDTFYRIPPRKPIITQVEDVFNGIADYWAHEVQAATQDGNTVYNVVDRDPNVPPLFEIYPFLGINTRNYTLKEIDTMLEKYFGEYHGDHAAFREKLGTFEGDIDDMGSNLFAGIKLYPPIGFDPRPSDNSERAKVERLYEVCCEKRIPVTAHCSDGGFQLDKGGADFTCPDKWAGVLSDKRFESLKLNLAHFGKQNKKRFGVFSQDGWRKRVLELLAYPNVYTDFSYIGVDDAHYRMLEEAFDANPLLATKLLFGSDFMINLLDVESYNSYLSLFSQTERFRTSQKMAFCGTNPEEFLWGKTP